MYCPKFLDKTSLLLVLTFLIIVSCVSKSGIGENEARQIDENDIEEYWIKFYKVNSRVKVYLNEEEVHDSGVHEEITKPFTVGLSDLIANGDNDLKIELFNGPPYDDSLGYDKYWEIDYEIFHYDEPIDFIYEVSHSGRNGMVWDKEHEISTE